MNWLPSGFPEPLPATVCSLVLNVCDLFRCRISQWTGRYEKTSAFSVGQRCATEWSPRLLLAVLQQQQPNQYSERIPGSVAACARRPVLIRAMGSITLTLVQVLAVRFPQFLLRGICNQGLQRPAVDH